MSNTTIRGNATRREPDAKRFAFFMPGPPRQLLKIFTCYLWGTHASRTKRATELPPRRFFPRALSSSTFRTQTPSFPPLFLRLPPFFCFAVPCGTTYSVAAPPLNSFIRSRRATPRTCQQRLENSTKCFTPLLLFPLPSHRRNNEYSYGLNF